MKQEGRMSVLGRWEWVTVPQLNGRRFRGRVDTGARRTALHAERIRVGEEQVRFALDGEEWQLPLLGSVRVRSSNGIIQQRPLVPVTLGIGETHVDMHVTLADRSRMRFPILIGRDMLAGRFLVDVSREGPSGPDGGTR